jgi:hypothetical protein
MPANSMADIMEKYAAACWVWHHTSRSAVQLVMLMWIITSQSHPWYLCMHGAATAAGL